MATPGDLSNIVEPDNYAFTDAAFRKDMLASIPRFKKYIESPIYKRKEKVIASIRERGSRFGGNLTANPEMMSIEEQFLEVRKCLKK